MAVLTSWLSWSISLRTTATQKNLLGQISPLTSNQRKKQKDWMKIWVKDMSEFYENIHAFKSVVHSRYRNRSRQVFYSSGKIFPSWKPPFGHTWCFFFIPLQCASAFKVFFLGNVFSKLFDQRQKLLLLSQDWFATLFKHRPTYMFALQKT